MNKIDFEFACRALGERCLDIKAPDRARPRAGVEIGRRLDLASMKASDLRRLPLPESLKKKLSTYLGKTGAELAASWRWQPLRLSVTERAALLRLEATPRLRPLNARYMSAASNRRRKSLGSLPSAAQTALFLLDWDTKGRPEYRVPSVWEALCQQDWPQAQQMLTRSAGLPTRSSVGRLLGSLA